MSKDPGGSSSGKPLSAEAVRVLWRMGAAAMLGAAIFLIEAGAAQLILRADGICQGNRAESWAFAARGCQPEAIRWFLQGFSSGVVGAVAPQLSPVLGVATMAIGMGLVAAILSRLPLRHAIPAFLVVQVSLGGAFGVLGFFLAYVV